MRSILNVPSVLARFQRAAVESLKVSSTPIEGKEGDYGAALGTLAEVAVLLEDFAANIGKVAD